MEKQKKTRKQSVTLRWSREPRESGLRAIGQGPRGWRLHWGPEQLASVSVMRRGWDRTSDGWMFWAREDSLGVPLRNTSGERGKPPEMARAECVEYVLQCLRAAHPDITFKPPTRCPGADPEQPNGGR